MNNFMVALGVYSKEIKNKYLKIKPHLDDKELVMVFQKGNKKITNQIMQAWETPYMKKLAQIATSRGGNVLEIGFGMGISAGFIQKSKKIKKHYIIECHPVMIKFLKKKFSKSVKNSKLVLLKGFWENVIKKIPPKSFDGILFDSCPLDKEVEFFQFFPFFKEAFRLLKDDGIFTYFSDEPFSISKSHRKLLKSAGFKNIDFQISKVDPPKDCLYWKHGTIVAPIIKKN
ncbi:MAG: class I SAM-dependent methyltransferase [bacterium]|nr:class I SAM-dependent methyltransferase [bacterium]